MDRFRVIVEDNGPGIVKKQVPNIFGKLLYGSKFHRLKQSRGQQGIGISAAALYGQLTTGKPIKIFTRISPKHPANYYELKINTQKNEPTVLKEETMEWNKEHGTKIEIDLEGSYQSGGQSVDKYLKQTAIVNPHVTIIYTNPEAKQMIFPRAVEELPAEPKEIKPHPYGVELGRLMKMINNTKARSISGFGVAINSCFVLLSKKHAFNSSNISFSKRVVKGMFKIFKSLSFIFLQLKHNYALSENCISHLFCMKNLPKS